MEAVKMIKIDRKIINGSMDNEKIKEIIAYSQMLNKRIKKYEHNI